MSATTHDRSLIAIIDSDGSLRAELRVLLGAAAHAVEPFNSAEDFLKRNKSHSPHCIVLDVLLPGMSGLDLQSLHATFGCRTPFVFLTAHSEVRASVRAMNHPMTMHAGHRPVMQSHVAPIILSLEGRS